MKRTKLIALTLPLGALLSALFLFTSLASAVVCPLPMGKPYLSGTSTVIHYVTNKCTVRDFPTPTIFKSWFPSFSSVKFASNKVMKRIPVDPQQTMGKKNAPSITTFIATPDPAQPGEAVTLSWNVANSPTSLSIAGIGAVSGSTGSTQTTVTTDQPVTYTLTAANSTGKVTAQRIINKPRTCTSFTYSGWGDCQSNSIQTRTVATQSPTGCTGGTPILTQTCTYVPPTTNVPFTYVYGQDATVSSGGSTTFIEDQIQPTSGANDSLDWTVDDQITSVWKNSTFGTRPTCSLGTGMCGTITASSCSGNPTVCTATYVAPVRTQATSSFRFRATSHQNPAIGDWANITVNGTAPVSNSYPVNVSITGSGTVTCNGGSCSNNFTQGSMVAIVANPSSGYTLSGWGGACSGTSGSTCNLTVGTSNSVAVTFSGGPTPPPSTNLGPLGAFPGCEGSGCKTRAGFDSAQGTPRVYNITNLSSGSGSGSLGECVAAVGPRVCLFKVSGTINAAYSITNPYITIDARSAPGGGIQIARPGVTGGGPLFNFTTHDVVLRGLRIRPGADVGITGDLSEKRCLRLYNDNGADLSRLVFDHNSFEYGNSSCIDIYTRNTNSPGTPANEVTLSWNLEAENLTAYAGDSYRVTESRGGVLACRDATSCAQLSPSNTNIDYHHNLFASLGYRQPDYRAWQGRYVNNYIYNWGLEGLQVAGTVKADIIGNAWQKGAMFATSQSLGRGNSHPIELQTGGESSEMDFPTTQAGPYYYFVQNIDDQYQTNYLNDNWTSGIACGGSSPGSCSGNPNTSYKRTSPLPVSPYGYAITATDPVTAKAVVTAGAGASQRVDCGGNIILNRDTVDARIAAYVANGGGLAQAPETETSLGLSGIPNIPNVGGATCSGRDNSACVCADSNGNGIPDYWESRVGLGSNANPFGHDLDSNWTNLEVYLSGMKPVSDSGPTPTTCTSFTYSAWGACQSNNIQTRTVATQSPTGCTGGTPILTQTCTYVPPTTNVPFTYVYGQDATVSSGGSTTFIEDQIQPTSGANDSLDWTVDDQITSVWKNSTFGTRPACSLGTGKCGTITASSCSGNPTICTATYVAPVCTQSICAFRFRATSHQNPAIGDWSNITVNGTVSPNTCTSFTYSCGACTSNNTKTCSVQSSSPAGCTGGTPVLSQSCTYIPPAPATTIFYGYDKNAGVSDSPTAAPYGGVARYASPTGSGSCTISSPCSLTQAVSVAVAGDSIYLRGGTYTSAIDINKSGTAGKPIEVRSYPGEWAVFDGSGASMTASTGFLTIDGSYVNLKNLEVKNFNPGSGNPKGILINGSHNELTNIYTHHNGEGVKTWGVDTTYTNCTAEFNNDPQNGGGNGDGFEAQNAAYVKYVRTVSRNNADDGYDVNQSNYAYLEDTISWANGYFPDGSSAGDGNGYKIAWCDSISGGVCVGTSYGNNTLVRVVASGNRVSGIDDELGGPVTVKGASLVNQTGALRLRGSFRQTLYNTVIAGGDTGTGLNGGTCTSCAGVTGGVLSTGVFEAVDFASLNNTAAGSRFMYPISSSLVDKGAVLSGLTYNGSAPDIGAVESGGGLPSLTCTSFTYSCGVCQSNGTKICTVLSSLPTGCTGGSPALTQTCTYTPPAPSTYPINVTITGQGTVTCNGGSCANNFSQGSLVTIVASPSTGYTLSSWGGACVGISQNSCNLTIGTSNSVSVTFSGGTGGAFTYVYGQDATVNSGGTTTFLEDQIQPTTGSSDSLDWTVDDNLNSTWKNSTMGTRPTCSLGAGKCGTITASSCSGNPTVCTATYVAPVCTQTACSFRARATSHLNSAIGDWINITVNGSGTNPTCTFAYSAWSPSTCPSSGVQTRTVTATSPAGCSGGTPVLSQSCTPPPVSGSFRFVSWSDTKSGLATFSSLSNQVKALSPTAAFTIYPGDLCESGPTVSCLSDINAWKDSMNGDINNGIFNISFISRGNHDADGTGVWQSFFNFAGVASRVGATNYSELTKNLTYSFDYGNSHFVALDAPGGDASTLDTSMAPWLDADLTAAESRGLTHAFIFFHGAEYYVDDHSDSGLPSAFITVFNKHPIISATFHGHEHVEAYVHISSARIPGITHPYEEFVSAGAGADLYTCSSGRSDWCVAQFGFAVIDVSGSNFTVSMYQLGQTTPVKSWSFTKSNSCTASTWTPDPVTVCSGTSFTQTSNCGTTRLVSGTKICTANSYPVNVSITGQGTVTCNGGSCSNSFTLGSIVSIVASPATGYTLSNWGGACSGISGSTCNLTIGTSNSATVSFSGGTSVPFTSVYGQDATVNSGGTTTFLEDQIQPSSGSNDYLDWSVDDQTASTWKNSTMGTRPTCSLGTGKCGTITASSCSGNPIVCTATYVAPVCSQSNCVFRFRATSHQNPAIGDWSNITVSGSNPTPPPTPSACTGSTAQKLAAVAQQGILYMHASIGDGEPNDGVLAGLQRLDHTNGNVLNVGTEWWNAQPTSVAPGHIASYKFTGGNGGYLNDHPDQKLDAFDVTWRKSGIGDTMTMAQMKFCYTDFNDSWDNTTAYIDSTIWPKYQQDMAALKAAHPNVRIIHWTVPLVFTGYDSSNPVREYLSNKIRATYPSADIFDIADYQSKDANGQNQCLSGGVRCENSQWALSSSDPHMTSAGYDNAAKHWLDTMACSASPTPPPTPTTCTSFTYSCGICQSSGTKTCTVLSSLPSGCSGGNPQLTQSCTYVPPTSNVPFTSVYGQDATVSSGGTTTFIEDQIQPTTGSNDSLDWTVDDQTASAWKNSSFGTRPTCSLGTGKCGTITASSCLGNPTVCTATYVAPICTQTTCFFRFRATSHQNPAIGDWSNITVNGTAPVVNSYPVNVTITGQGTVTCNGGSCANNFTQGTVVSIVATPVSGYTLSGWGGACAGISGNTCNLTIGTSNGVSVTFSGSTPPPPPPSTSLGPLGAFPGCEGSGCRTRGGYAAGSKVYLITSLSENSGTCTLNSNGVYTSPSSCTLRTCLAASGPKVCIFKVSGNIHLTSQLAIPSNTTIDGFSAPGGGIQIEAGGQGDMLGVIDILGSNVVIRGIQIRPGYNTSNMSEGGEKTCMRLHNDSSLGNSVFDHLTCQWSNHSSIDTWQYNNGNTPSHDITFSWNAIVEPLNSYPNDSTRLNESRAMIEGCGRTGSELSDCTAISPNTDNIDFHHSLIYTSGIRNPLYKLYGGVLGYNAIGWSLAGPDVVGTTKVDIVNNVFQRSPMSASDGSHGRSYPIELNVSDSSGDGDSAQDWVHKQPAPLVYMNGNITTPLSSPAISDSGASNWSSGIAQGYGVTNQNSGCNGSSSGCRRSAPRGANLNTGYAITDTATASVANTVLGGAGAMWRINCAGVREQVTDPNLERVKAKWASNSDLSRAPKTETDLGLPGITNITNVSGTTCSGTSNFNCACADANGNGLPDYWESRVGLGSGASALGHDLDPNWTNLEVYLSGTKGV